jgi:hypothetical protein
MALESFEDVIRAIHTKKRTFHLLVGNRFSGEYCHWGIKNLP